MLTLFLHKLGLDAAPLEHVQAARQTRVRYDGVRQRAFQRMQGWAAEE